MTENGYKIIKRTIETIEEKVPLDIKPAAPAPRRPSWITLVGLTMTVVGLLISIAEYLDKRHQRKLEMVPKSSYQRLRTPKSEQIRLRWKKYIREQKRKRNRELRRKEWERSHQRWHRY